MRLSALGFSPVDVMHPCACQRICSHSTPILWLWKGVGKLLQFSAVSLTLIPDIWAPTLHSQTVSSSLLKVRCLTQQAMRQSPPNQLTSTYQEALITCLVKIVTGLKYAAKDLHERLCKLSASPTNCWSHC